jgi:hypothetical protein
LLLDGRRSVDEVVHELAEKSGIEPDVASAEIRSVIAQFEELGLVVRRGPGGFEP